MGSIQSLEKSRYRGRTLGKINASLDEKLKSVEWGEYKLGDIFEILSVKKATKQNVRKYKNSEFNTPVVYCKFGDNGIMYWGRKNEFTTYKNVISVIYNGAIAAGKVYAQREKTGILAESYFIRLKKHKSTHNINLFLASVIEKTLYYKYSREYLATWAGRVENDTIYLPTKKGEINFDFMESFIAELEAERLAELEAERLAELSAYLTVSGLDDYELSEEEKVIVDDFNNISFCAFAIKELFDIKNTNNIISRDIIENSGKTPYLCASAENNSVNSYISYDNKYIDKGNCIFIGGKTFVVSYQEEDFYSNDSHNLALYLRDNKERTKLKQLCLATCVKKSMQHKYSWGNSISHKKITSDIIFLPTKDGKPDYRTMEILISAVQKLVIKDVVLYTDKRVKATKEIITK